MLFKIIRCILGYHRYNKFSIYSSTDDTWYTYTKCRFCKHIKNNKVH